MEYQAMALKIPVRMILQGFLLSYYLDSFISRFLCVSGG